MYALIARVFGLCIDLFYRRRSLGGSVPPDGPCILVANHPNGLVDPVLVMRVAGRRVRFLGKAPLFRMPVIGWLMRGVEALPVYRAKDGADTRDNDTTFRAVYDALAQGDCVCLFPEGVSHDEPALQPLKTGAARMALGAEAAHGFALGVRLVPVGLTYRAKGTFRSEVALEIGPPIEVRDHAAAHAADPQEAARALTATIDAAIRKVTLNLDTWDDLPLLELASAVWPGGADDPALRLRLLAEGHRDFLARAPARLSEVRLRLGALGDALRQLGWPAAALDRDHHPGKVGRFVLRNVVALLLGLPTALAGAIAYVVPYQGVRLLARLTHPTPDLVGTTKMLASVLLFPIWQAAMMTALVLWLGPLAGLALGVVLPFAGIYTHHFLERRAAALREVRLFFALISRARVRAHLRAERDALRAAIDALAAD